MIWKLFLNHFYINLQTMTTTKMFSCKSLKSSILLINAKSEHRFWDSFGTWLFWERRIGAHLLKINSHISYIASSVLSELPIKLVRLNKLSGNDRRGWRRRRNIRRSYTLIFNNLGIVVFPGRNFWPPCAPYLFRAVSKGNEPFLKLLLLHQSWKRALL